MNPVQLRSLGAFLEAIQSAEVEFDVRLDLDSVGGIRIETTDVGDVWDPVPGFQVARDSDGVLVVLAMP